MKLEEFELLVKVGEKVRVKYWHPNGKRMLDTVHKVKYCGILDGKTNFDTVNYHNDFYLIPIKDIEVIKFK